MLGGIIGAVGGAVGSIFGGIARNKMLRKQMEMVEAKKSENRNWYDRRYNEDATQLADAQAMLSRTAEAIRNRRRDAAGAAAVMGGTEESLAASKAADTKAMADATGRIAVAGAQRKNAVEQQYLQKNDLLDETLRNLEGQKRSALDIAGGALGGAADGFASGIGLEEILKKRADGDKG